VAVDCVIAVAKPRQLHEHDTVGIANRDAIAGSFDAPGLGKTG
jgi:hypothetical protein